MLTVEQANAYLQTVGVNLPEWLLLALLEQVNSIEACLLANGATPGQVTLALTYLLGLIGLAQGDRYVSSQRAPSGAAQSFRFQTVGARWRGLYALLKGIDKWGCTDSLIPQNPEGVAHAAIWSVTGGCYE